MAKKFKKVKKTRDVFGLPLVRPQLFTLITESGSYVALSTHFGFPDTPEGIVSGTREQMEDMQWQLRSWNHAYSSIHPLVGIEETRDRIKAEYEAAKVARAEAAAGWCFGDTRGVKKTLAQREQAHKMERDADAARTGWGGDY